MHQGGLSVPLQINESLSEKVDKHDVVFKKPTERVADYESLAELVNHNNKLPKQRLLRNNISIFGILDVIH